MNLSNHSSGANGHHTSTRAMSQPFKRNHHLRSTGGTILAENNVNDIRQCNQLSIVYTSLSSDEIKADEEYNYRTQDNNIVWFFCRMKIALNRVKFNKERERFS